MITFEDILPHLCELFIEKLPLYIEEMNKIHNDGLIIYPFENKTLFENCQKLPCFKIELQEAEYSEKDRIIENTVFDFSLEIKIKYNGDTKLLEISRYVQAIDKMLNETELNNLKIIILTVIKEKIKFRIVL